MEAILGVLIVETLRKEGIITDEQATQIISITDLSQVLQDLKLVQPLSKSDKKDLDKLERIISRKGFSLDKIKEIREMDMSKIENSTLRKTMEAFQKKVEEWIQLSSMNRIYC